MKRKLKLNKYTLQRVSLCILLVSTFNTYAMSLQDAFREDFEHTFAGSVILFDQDAITLGIHELNLSQSIGQFKQVSNSETVENRKGLSIISLPYTIKTWQGEGYSRTLHGRFSWMSDKQKIDLTDVPEQDEERQQIFEAYLGIDHSYSISERISLTAGLAGHLMYLKNDFAYRSGKLDGLKPIIDGQLVNTTAWSAMIEPSIELKYAQQQKWGSWYLWSAAHYVYGTSWGEANNGDLGNPETAYWVNGAKSFYELGKVLDHQSQWYVSFQRIDISDGISQAINANYYYKATTGWLISEPIQFDWVKNVGVGVNLNYGSALKGISLVLFINQD
ncbi:Solitary outer membrane autotransporter beta-barrel domain [Photobacterium swingsii]|uniref:Solitary outer membrane autotransporter beta-barrel domain n=1 Tax=Photobacterium swingsii TaxID=680026 RepID=UPI0040685B82